MGWIAFVLQYRAQIITLTIEHIWLVAASVVLAAVIGLPAAVFVLRRPAWGRLVLGGANVLQTIPSLALFGLLLPIPWIGAAAVRLTVVVLTLYCLLPIIRSTHAGLAAVDPALVEAGRGMGMTDRQLLFQLQFPLALPVIMAGLRVAAVISIGVATIAAAIGAGGLGELIFRGVAMVDNRLILAGAVPAALLALVADLGFGRLEKLLAPAR